MSILIRDNQIIIGDKNIDVNNIKSISMVWQDLGKETAEYLSYKIILIFKLLNGEIIESYNVLTDWNKVFFSNSSRLDIKKEDLITILNQNPKIEIDEFIREYIEKGTYAKFDMTKPLYFKIMDKICIFGLIVLIFSIIYFLLDYFKIL